MFAIVSRSTFVVLLLFARIAGAQEYRPIEYTDFPLTDIEAQTIRAFLDEMDPSLIPNRRIRPAPAPPPEPAPAPTPDPEPQPPAPEPKPSGDDFFDDDGFFSDDDAGFDEFVDRIDTEFDETVAAWDREYEEQVRRWREGNQRHIQRIPRYQAATITLEAGLETEPELPLESARVSEMQPGDFHLIPGAMTMAVRDQDPRGTCTAFASVRALETLLAQHQLNADLSEQQFYAITKGCLTRACGGSQGASAFDGFEALTRYRPGLLEEAKCPYVAALDENDITQTQVRQCVGQEGIVRSGRYFTTKSLDRVLDAIRSNQPVVLGLGVTCALHRNAGLVKAVDPVNQSGRDCSGGHAMLGIGYVRMPQKMASEGRYCMIIANSWTEDWGNGGYACLTERYLKEQSFFSHAVLQSVTLTSRGAGELRVSE
ncbi:MAG: C1 family peptidase [Pseudomonadota bacterium]